MLCISDLSVEYRGGNIRAARALNGVSLNIPAKGYTLGIVGESGSGKTTLGLSIMNVIEPPGRILEGSKIEFDGNDVLYMSKKQLRNYRWEKVAMVYQSAMNSLNPVKPIFHPIVEVLKQHGNCGGAEAYEQAIDLLSKVGIDRTRTGDYPHELSGGMRQRVCVALALACSPQLLIADEPTSALDVVVQQQILELIMKQVEERALSLIFITHEISLLCGVVQNVAVMYRGEIVELGPVDKVLFEPLHPYTEMLLDTMLSMDTGPGILGSDRVRKSLGLKAHLAARACRYSHRCRYAFSRCANERPELKEVERGRWVACFKH